MQRFCESYAFDVLDSDECAGLVDRMCEQLRAAAAGERFGFAVAGIRAELAFMIDAPGWHRPDEAQCDRLLEALRTLRAAAPRHLPKDIDPADIARGFDELASMIRMWAEPDERRTDRHPHHVADLFDTAEIFANGSHSWALAQAIQDRRRSRRAATNADVAETRRQPPIAGFGEDA